MVNLTWLKRGPNIPCLNKKVFQINPKVPNMQNKGVNNCTLKLNKNPISNIISNLHHLK